MNDCVAGVAGLIAALPTAEGAPRDDSHNFYRLMRFIEASKETEDFYFQEYVNGIWQLLKDDSQDS